VSKAKKPLNIEERCPLRCVYCGAVQVYPAVIPWLCPRGPAERVLVPDVPVLMCAACLDGESILFTNKSDEVIEAALHPEGRLPKAP
jgi:hypothetical protein